MPEWLESELQRGLREVTAPPDLWDRVQAARVPQPNSRPRRLVLAMAATVTLAALALSHQARRDRISAVMDSPELAFHCENPAQLRAWVKANTGLDVPMRSSLPASIQLFGATRRGNTVEIAYRAGERDAQLLVSRADGAADIPHNRASGATSTWVMAGRKFTLAYDNPADAQIACKLCHLD
jgi:hypothetical protein